jgi:5-hydroxyisourate hydrolase
MGRLTTHVLDTSAGIPAPGVRIEVHGLSSSGCELLATQVTGADGRCSAPLLEDSRLCRGSYQLTFHVADYFRAAGLTLPEPAFIEEAVVRFGVARPDQHYHVPLLISPWAYSVYRGG